MAIDKFEGDNRFLSNFYFCEVVYDGIKYITVEHAYQASKTENRELKLRFAEISSPKDAKRFGRKIDVRKDWDDIKLQVMEDLLRLKFQDKDLLKKLLATGTEELIEGNTWNDRFWGVCGGNGENHLGKLLMKIRDEFKDVYCRKCGEELDRQACEKKYEVCSVCFGKDYQEFCAEWVKAGKTPLNRKWEV